jgi:hypothetical protein
MIHVRYIYMYIYMIYIYNYLIMYIVIIHKQFTKPRFPMITMLILAISNGMTITKPPTFPTTLDILNLNRHLEGNESMWCPIISNS